MPENDDGNGWKAGTDPTLRIARIITVVVFLGTMVLMVLLDRVDPALGGAIIVGLLGLLGIWEGVALKWPWDKQ